MLIKKIIFFLIYFKLSLACSFYKTLETVENLNQYYIIDMRPTYFSETEFFENSVHFEWQQLSQLGLPSRGYLKKNTRMLISDLADLGIHPEKKIIIIGRGLRGRGEEGRVAYMLSKYGFSNVFVSTKKYLIDKGFKIKLKVPPHVTPSALFEVKINSDLSISREEMKALLNDHKKTVTCIDVRPKNNPEQLFNLKYFCKKIEWKVFFTADMKIDQLVVSQLSHNEMNKKDLIIVLSEAGLSSAGVTLALRELGFLKAVNFEGGYSDLRSLLLDSNILSPNF